MGSLKSKKTQVFARLNENNSWRTACEKIVTKFPWAVITSLFSNIMSCFTTLANSGLLQAD